MKKITTQLLLSAVAVFLIAACTNSQGKDLAEVGYKTNGEAVYPFIEGMIPFAINVAEKEDEEANKKILVEVGKMMEVDCNQHRLGGNFEVKVLDEYQFDYYIFNTDGNVASTMMACPDDQKTNKFVSGEGQFISYNSKHTIPIYAPEGYEVRYTIWGIAEEFTATQNPDEAVNEAAAKQLNSYPESIKEYDRYVIYLPQQEQEENLRLEVIPGITKDVDCNTHWLIGDFETKEIEGMGYDYLVFNSNGDIAATRMACPDYKLTEKFVAATGHFGRYNSRLPIVVFVPKGIEVKYKTWEAQETFTADKL